MRQELMDQISDLEDISGLLKSEFVAKDEFIEMMILCAMAQEHLLAVGPPGTAKSAIVKRFTLRCSSWEGRNGDIPYFEYLLTRFTEPNEIFGPVDIRKFQEGGGHCRITDSMLPKAEIAFLDEVFKANSAILNALLTILNERVFYNGGVPEPVPLLCSVGATNEVPEDPSLAAIYDRFLVRIWTDNVEEARFTELFSKGWKLETERIRESAEKSRKSVKNRLRNITTTDQLREIHGAINEVKLDGILREYREAVRRIRAEGIALSDRRVIKLIKLIAASALRRKSMEANPGDFWVLRHIWNTPDQIPHLQSIIEPYLEGFEAAEWRAERKLEVIENAIRLLEADQNQLKTDADFADFLHRAETLRRELMTHSDESGKKAHLDHLNGLIDAAMEKLEQEE